MTPQAVCLQATGEPIAVDLCQELLGNILDPSDTGQAHTQPKLIDQQPQAQLDALLAFIREAPEDGAADPDEVGAEGEGLEDVGAVADAAVDMHGDFLLHRRHHLRQRVQSRQRPVQLPPAVVRHHNPVHPVVHCQQRVLRRRDPLHPHLHRRRDLLQPRDRTLP